MLLKEDDTAGDIFQCTLGNLPPKTDAKISFSYVIELPQEPDGKIRFTLPTVLNPRYSQGILVYIIYWDILSLLSQQTKYIPVQTV